VDVKNNEMRVPPKYNDKIFLVYQEYIEEDEVEEQPKKQPKNGSSDSHSDLEMEEN